MTREQVKEQLRQLAEQEYRAFNQKLLPGVPGILGVRLPKLREMAKQAAKTDASEYLGEIRDCRPEDLYYEEKMVFGMVIGYAGMDEKARSGWLDVFVPLIDSWGVCDSCCMTYKWMKKHPDYWWDYLKRSIEAGTEFGIRFGLVCMLAHFVDEEHLTGIFDICSQLDSRDYYAQMAAAWLVSACFVKFPQQSYVFLQDSRMDDFTHNKSIQKTCESYRVSGEWKEKIRVLRRK